MVRRSGACDPGAGHGLLDGMEEGAVAPRSLGLLGATGIGVGAIVGGGILALAGVAFAATGPAALLAFALNGVIAVLTALSFAEISAAFPSREAPTTSPSGS